MNGYDNMNPGPQTILKYCLRVARETFEHVLTTIRPKVSTNLNPLHQTRRFKRNLLILIRQTVYVITDFILQVMIT